MSRRMTFRQAATSATPATKPAKSTASGIASHTVSRAPGTKIEREHDQDREHHRERDRLGRDDREGDELAREAHLLDQLGAVDHRARARLERDGEEEPAGDPGEQVERVVRDLLLLVPDQAEDEQVDRHQRQRVDERPDDTERRAAVLGVEVAPEEIREELPVADEIGVDGHPRQCRGARRRHPRRRRAAAPERRRTRRFRPPRAVASSQGANGVRLPSVPVSTAVAIIALPAASAVIWLLLHSPAARRLSDPDRGPLAAAPRRRASAASASSPASRSGSGAPPRSAPSTPSEQLAGIYAAVALVFAAGLADDLYGLPPLAKLLAQFAAAAIVLSTGTHVQLIHNQLIGDAIAVLWLIGVANAFNLLDNMDGLAATLAAIAFGFFAVDAVTVHPSDASLAFALAGGLACVGFLPFNLRRGPALVFMGDSGSQMLGFALAALGLTSSWRVAGTTVATLLLPDPRARDPDPRHHARHGRAAARRPPDPPGRPRPLLAPARALRPLRAARGRAARADLVLHRRLEPRLQRRSTTSATRSSASS